jgi:hypothetical protein
MTERERDDLRTADIAEQQPAEPTRPDHDLAEETDFERRDDVAARDDLVDRDRADDAVDFGRPGDAVAAERIDAGRPAASDASAAGPLLASQDAEGFRARWNDIQNGFVDAPRQAVERADGLTAELMQHLAKTFADERSGLESQWDRGDDVSTDDLRTAFQRYRSFFERLLSA